MQTPQAVADHFPNSKVMICGGHAGRAHKKQLEKLQKMKTFTVDAVQKYKDNLAMWSVVAQGTNRDVVASLQGIRWNG